MVARRREGRSVPQRERRRWRLGPEVVQSRSPGSRQSSGTAGRRRRCVAPDLGRREQGTESRESRVERPRRASSRKVAWLQGRAPESREARAWLRETRGKCPRAWRWEGEGSRAVTRGRARDRRASREERRRCIPRQSTVAGGLRPAPVAFRAPVCKWPERQASRAASCRKIVQV